MRTYMMKSILVFILGAVACWITPGVATAEADDAPAGSPPATATEVATVEGITEYRLDNGLRFLLFPDQSQQQITVNITYLVGSRHEGYGETGMAHLLVKGTPSHPNLFSEFDERGGSFNANTRLRTCGAKSLIMRSVLLSKSPFGMQPERLRFPGCNCEQEDPSCPSSPLADITRAHVLGWFAARWATPAAADRSLPVLSVILKEAERLGYRPEGSNPCRGIRRYRRRGRERYLSDAEIGRLGSALSAHEREYPRQVAAVRLLLLTGCRRSEVLTLRWSDYREGRLFLRDSKAGPRTVWLSRPARNVLEGLERADAWVFPAPRAHGPASETWLRRFWERARRSAAARPVPPRPAPQLCSIGT